MEKLYEWAKKEGAQHVNTLTFKNYPGGYNYGGEVKREIDIEKEGEVNAQTGEREIEMMSIPFKMMLNYRRAIEDKEFYETMTEEKIMEAMRQGGGENDEKEEDMATHTFSTKSLWLYLYIMVQKLKKEKSYWYPYMQALPEKYETAIYYDKKLVERELKGTTLKKSIETVQQQLDRAYEHIMPLLTTHNPEQFPKEQCTKELFYWAYSTVWSRVFPITYKEDNEVVPTLLPFIDILNHQYGAKIAYETNYEKERFSLKSRETLHANQQLFNNYGGKSNDSFLLAYGFVVEGNTEDTLPIKLSLHEPNDNLKTLKEQLFKRENLPNLYYVRAGVLPDALKQRLRIALLNEQEAYAFQDVQQKEWGIITPRNEAQCINILRTLLHHKLQDLWGNAADDKTLINNPIGSPEHAIGVYRQGQRHIIQHLIQETTQWEVTWMQANQQRNLTLMFPNVSIPESTLLEKNITKEAVPKDSVLKTLSSNDCYMESQAKQHPFVSFAQQNGGYVDTNVCMMIYILEQRHKHQHPSLMALPTNLGALPLFQFSNVEYDLLQNTLLMEEHEDTAGFIQHTLPLVQTFYAAAFKVTEDIWYWCYVVVQQLLLHVGNEPMIALDLVPLLAPSLLFHQKKSDDAYLTHQVAAAPSLYLFPKDGLYELRSIASIPANAKLHLLHVNPLSNVNLISKYGACQTQAINVHEAHRMELSMEEVADFHTRMLHHFHIENTHFLYVKSYPQRLMNHLTILQHDAFATTIQKEHVDDAATVMYQLIQSVQYPVTAIRQMTHPILKTYIVCKYQLLQSVFQVVESHHEF